MGFKEFFQKLNEKKNEEKEMLKSMERDMRLKRKLENKLKSPTQKEHEFYERERNRDNLNSIVKKERKERDIRMKKLSDPFNKNNNFCMKNNLMMMDRGKFT